MKYYTGVGSRETPEGICLRMTNMAFSLMNNGFILRSGGADGADRAFEEGCLDLCKREIFIPWDGFENHFKSEEGIYELKDFPTELKAKAWSLVKEVHPAWERLSEAAAKLHARNVFQVLGQDLNTPSSLLICWTPKGETVGGTATAIRLAEKFDIPVWNLGK